MLFERVIAGIDGTRASFEAGRQASRLTRDDGSLTLLAAADPHYMTLNHWGPKRLVGEHETQELGGPSLAEERLHEFAAESLAAMEDQLARPHAVTRRVVAGSGHHALRQHASAEGADLIAVGDHGFRRLVGIARASTATELLHDAPCSVLLARQAFDSPSFPRSIAVGVDGSEGSFAALEVAKGLAGDGVRCEVVVSGTDAPDDEIARRAAPLAVVHSSARAAKALTEASEAVDLLVVGARGLSGAAALGSVSERVAHGAESSVLVVRTRD